jgi:hypothetical protein
MNPQEYMKGHPDAVTPLEYLQDRLKVIEHYVWRLEKSGNTGTAFMDFYKGKVDEYRGAIKLLQP